MSPSPRDDARSPPLSLTGPRGSDSRMARGAQAARLPSPTCRRRQANRKRAREAIGLKTRSWLVLRRSGDQFRDLTVETESLNKELERYSSERSAVITDLAAQAIHEYEQLRKQRRGNALHSHFLRALTSVAIRNANRPYWARSTSASFNNFGSTMGSNLGISLVQK